MPVHRSVLLVLAIGCLAAGASHAQWKWTDSQGRVQYSDLPPPAGTPDARILQRPNAAGRKGGTTVPEAPAASGAASAAGATLALPKRVEPELEARRRQTEKDEAEKRRADEARVAAARADNCKRAKNQLRALDDGMRIERVNDKGEREVLDDKARAAEVARSRAVIGADCR